MPSWRRIILCMVITIKLFYLHKYIHEHTCASLYLCLCVSVTSVSVSLSVSVCLSLLGFHIHFSNILTIISITTCSSALSDYPCPHLNLPPVTTSLFPSQHLYSSISNSFKIVSLFLWQLFFSSFLDSMSIPVKHTNLNVWY